MLPLELHCVAIGASLCCQLIQCVAIQASLCCQLIHCVAIMELHRASVRTSPFYYRVMVEMLPCYYWSITVLQLELHHVT